MINLLTKRKKIAIALLTIWGFNIFIPAISYALTSGPAQPETKGFQVAGVADMVDLQSGDLKYNIPLLDIDGYPLNLSYQSGTGIDDEASWVGLGWSLNPGAINRQVRGVPDDFSGDIVETDHYVKPKVTVGGRMTSKVEFVGIAAISGSFTFGVFSDNYTGIGAELGANAGISYSFANDGMLTAGLGAGVLSNTQSGVDASVSPYVSMAIKAKSDENLTTNAGLSGSLGYNTRSGMKSFTLGASFGFSNHDDTESGGVWSSGSANYSILGSTITYNTPPVSPSIQIPYTSAYNSFSFDVGGELESLFLSGGGTGYRNVRQVKNVVNKKPAFGFLYADRGKDNADAVMDFIREKDNPIIPEIPNIALPIHTPDTWSYTSQTGSGQFRLYRATGAFFDNTAEDVSTVGTAGIDLGLGSWVHGGVTYFEQHAKTTSRKWTGGNAYLPVGDFQPASTNEPHKEHTYFRQVGEKSAEDADLDPGPLQGSQALAVDIQGVTSTPNFRNTDNLYGPPNINIPKKIAKTSRRPTRTVISYLTAGEAQNAALDKKISNYDFKDPSMDGSLVAEPIPIEKITRSGGIYQPHHFSEITVTDDGGKRMVYGVPVYNTLQDEYSFAVDTTRDASHLSTVPNLTVATTTPSSNTNGIDNFYHKESKPGYATSFLLSAILSPDYVDKTGNGISDDDLGTAIKFNYSKLSHPYKWRTPYTKATANRGLMADPEDDKGSIVYGEKEIWYVQSIESKTKIAYFITGDRSDALGVGNWQAGGRDLTNTQKYLQEIRLYSKADMTRPIKVVKFKYDYSLCRGVPNSADAGSTDATKGGKLTLTRVWFEYGNSDKGKNHPYLFSYNSTTSHYGGANTPVYGYNMTDRWGIYKPAAENASNQENEQYPYTNQDASYTNENAALWHLNTIMLPTGGMINVTYESNDYAYVQNKKAMVMAPLGLIDATGAAISAGSTTPLKRATGISVNIGSDPAPPAGPDITAWFKNTYLDGSDYIYTKTGIKMATSNLNDHNPMPFDFVPTYSLVKGVTFSSGIAKVQLTPITEGSVTENPIIISAWQRLKNEYPRYAYPGFENRVKSGDISLLAAVSAIVNAAKNLTELKKSFYQKSYDRGYASDFLPNQSFAKITRVNGFKLGGGCRVKKIQINDKWNTADNTSAQNAAYGQAYTYTTIDNGKTISSGVAAYEPAVGNDENALKQPVPYIEHIKGAINNYFDLELPFGESLYPAPAVGYSKVTVNDLDASGNPSTKTGAVVNEFYTAKDYPVKVTALPVKPFSPTPNNTYSLTRTDSDDELCLSQGYSIELNDMHGKPKAVRVMNQSGAEISSTVYSYNSTGNGDGLSLDNNVKVIDPASLQLTDKILGRDVDFFTDFREQETSNKGRTVNIGGDVFPLLPFLPFFGLPHFPSNTNNEYKLFRSACAVKTIQNYGILSKVVKTENGSSITTENIAYDALTGEALVTRTKNEFKKDIYTTNIPAYWVYKGMGAAYQNLGVLLSGFTTSSSGEIDPTLKDYLRAGDELVDVSPVSTGTKYWVIYNQAAAGGTSNTQKLIAQDGTLIKSASLPLVKIVRSGYRNMLGASTTTLVSLNSPISADGHLLLNSVANLDNTLKVINTSATTFDDNWGMKAPCPIIPVLPIVEDTTLDWHMRAGINVPSTGAYACVDTEANQYTSDLINHLQCNIPGSFFSGGGRLAASNIYPVESAFRVNYVINTTFTVSKTKTYYIGTGRVSGALGFIFDCFDDGISFTSSTNQWTILPVFLTAGTHILTMSIPYVSGQENAFGLEVYDNSLSEIRNAGSGAAINVIYSTAQLRGNQPLQSSTYDVAIHNIYHYKYTDGSPVSVCPVPPPPSIVNPYVTGFSGNWRPYQTKVFQQSRNYVFSTNLNNSSADVKNAGYINNFYPYWYYNGTSWAPNPYGSRWVTANTVTLYDKFGQQLENKDALGRFSAAKFDFNGELPSAVASNAMNREIYAASLEDSKFTPGSAANTDNCNIREFIQPSTLLTLKQLANTDMAHSGNYSALLPADGVSMATIFHSLTQKDNPYLTLDGQKQYITQTTPGLYPNGFEPYTGHSYIFDAWVNDALPNDKSINLALSINGHDVPLQCKAVVEGWKLVEGTIDLSTVAGATALNIAIVPATGKTIYIDDIRMHPFDAHMKTYAYDDKTMRLMAEIDENGFATFYEYDDEGLLVRVKKETEKGIMTLKESRSTYRRDTTP